MSERHKPTFYANVVNLRVTKGEVVLEFGAHFPDEPRPAPGPDYQPDVRIVLQRGVLAGLAKLMTQAEAQSKTMEAAEAEGKEP